MGAGSQGAIVTISFPVPVYLTDTSSPSPYTVDQRALETASPGSTDNTATNQPGNAIGVQNYLRPMQGSTSTNQALLTAGNAFGYGWALLIDEILAPDASEYIFGAGNWEWTLHYSRASGLGTGDMTCRFTVILFRVDSSLSVVSEIGRQTGGDVTFTTTEQSQAITISGSAVTFLTGEYLYVEVHLQQDTSVLVAAKRLHADSTTGTRLTAAPTFDAVRGTTGTASGTGAASGDLGAVSETTGTASGSATVTPVLAGINTTNGTAGGTSSVSAVMAGVGVMVGTSEGIATASAAASIVLGTEGTSNGVASVSGVLEAIAEMTGTAAGVATASGSFGAVSETVGTASGSATASGEFAVVAPTVGTVDIGEGGGETVITHIFAHTE